MRIVAVEPAFADGGIRFSLLVMQVFRFIQYLATAQVFIHHIYENRSCIRIVRISNDVPFGVSGLSCFVTTPTDIFTAKDNGLWSQLVNQFLPGGIVIPLSAFPLRMSSVEPYFINRTVFSQQFKQLVEEILIVIIHLKLKFSLVGKRAARNFTRNSSFGIFAQVSV